MYWHDQMQLKFIRVFKIKISFDKNHDL